MIRRVAVIAAAFFGSALAVAACDDHGGHHHRHARQPHAACGVQASCGTCTPVLGCGWCFSPAGGHCVDDPSDCAYDSTGFTWDPPGCTSEAGALPEASTDGRVLADAGLGSPEDAAPEAGDPAAGDASRD
jgi:hypothetical protein